MSTMRSRCPETSVRIRHYSLRKNTEGRRYQISSILWNAKVHHSFHKIASRVFILRHKSNSRSPSWFLPLLVSYQRISPSPKTCAVFRDAVRFLRCGAVSTSPNRQAWGPPVFGCARPLTQYICRYPTYLEDVSFIRRPRTLHVVVKGTHLENISKICINKDTIRQYTTLYFSRQ
jgi:hypothetical protein